MWWLHIRDNWRGHRDERALMKCFKWFGMLALLAAVLTASAGEDKPARQFWYEVTIALPNSEGKYSFVGRSSLSKEEIVKSLAKAEEFIKLDDCVYKDKKGKYRTWHEWDPTMEPRLYVNPKHIIVVHPLVGDPREVVPDSKSKKRK